MNMYSPYAMSDLVKREGLTTKQSWLSQKERRTTHCSEQPLRREEAGGEEGVKPSSEGYGLDVCTVCVCVCDHAVLSGMKSKQIILFLPILCEE